MNSNKASKLSNSVIASRSRFVPSEECVVAPSIVSAVFDDQPVPFQLNANGSVDVSVYDDWLNEVGLKALAALEEFSDTERFQPPH